MKRALTIGLFCASLLPWTSTALADVVSPPPDDCPDGTEAATCHGGPHCRPRTCATDADCTGGAKCVEQPFCTSEIVCAGLLPPDADINEYKRQKVDGLCPNGDECTADSTCSKLKVCASSSSPNGNSTGVASGGCSCRLASPEGSAGALIVAAMGAAAALQRRRSRQRRA